MVRGWGAQHVPVAPEVWSLWHACCTASLCQGFLVFELSAYKHKVLLFGSDLPSWVTISLGVYVTESRNSSQISWCRHWWFSSRFVFNPLCLHSAVVPSVGSHSLPPTIITGDGGLNACLRWDVSPHNLENHHFHDWKIGNVFCTTWDQKKDGCSIIHCGKREGVKSVISDVNVPTVLFDYS